MYVYGLIDPQTNCICYVGKADNIDKRLSSHLLANDISNLAKNRWIDSLKRQGLEPQIVVLEHAEDASTIFEAETRWIQTGLQLGWPLLNMHKTQAKAYGDKLTQEIGGWLLENHRDKIVDSLVDALLYELRAKSEEKTEPKMIGPTELQRMIWEWRQYNPDGRQAELIRHFAENGITVTSGYVSKIWNRQEEE